METINEDRLKELLNEQNPILNKNIELSSNLDIDVSKLNKVSFRNCTFNGADLYFKGSNNKDYHPLSLRFIKCNFNKCELNFSKFNIESIFFNEVHIEGFINLYDIHLSNIHFKRRCKISTLDILKLELRNKFNIEGRNVFNRLLITNTKFKDEVTFCNSIFNNLDILNSVYENEFNFTKNNIKHFLKIDNTNFENFNLSSNKCENEGVNFSINLTKNIFKGIADLSNWKAENVDLIIRDCNFEKLVRFNNSKFKNLHIEQTNFNDISSFQDTASETLFIDRTNFNKAAFFDDISILNIDECNKRTLRNIKHQLQRTNNKIDFDRFKSYEISAYRKELKKDKRFWYNDKDAFILNLSNLFSNNGTNWFQALIVTLLGSFLFYSLFFWININSFQLGNFDFSKIDSFLNGFAKFLIPTNIYNPLFDRTFVTGWSWFPFILGKIFLSIGIYEIIVSFRKFKS
ncbi:MAG: hypothetical protein ABJH82_06470 [Polaribacter sp.]|uniref:hypothetical protein n=1 Tax=Polaribacter sp. TaxID=1920175 RepID=UPI0032637177